MRNVRRCSRSYPNPTGYFWMCRSGCGRRRKHDEPATDARLEPPVRNYLRRFAKGVRRTFAGFLSEAPREIVEGGGELRKQKLAWNCFQASSLVFTPTC